ncbi:MAG: hypothetical protein ABW128_08300, partial [Rhizorhabdus sp.]
MSAALSVLPTPGALPQLGTVEPRVSSMRATRARLYVALLLLDLICIVGAFALASAIRFGHADFAVWVGVASCTAALFVVLAILSGSYCLDVLRRPSLGTARALSSLVLAFLLFFLVSYLLKVEADVSRALTLLAFVVSAVGLAVVRAEGGDWLERTVRGRLTNDVVRCDGVSQRFSDGYRTIDAQTIPIRPDP